MTAPYTGPTLTTITPGIEANIARVRSLCHAEIMAVVKADGYGLGAEHVARAALNAGCTWLGTTDVAEASQLRRAGFSVPILAWLHPAGLDVETAEASDVDIAIGSLEHLIQALRRGRGKLRIHLHLDTGMTRGGLPAYDWHDAMHWAAASEKEKIFRVVGLMGHLPNADAAEPSANDAGLRSFDVAHKMARKAGLTFEVRHLASTSATLTDPRTHFELVRIGAGLVGIDPSGSTELNPAARLTCPVVHTRAVSEGSPVGYGGSGTTREAGFVSVLGLGYADGIPQLLDPEAYVMIDGRACRILGRVNMDQIVVETGEWAAAPGTEAIIIGPDPGEPTVQHWAQWGNTSAHRIITGLGQRLHRVASTKQEETI
ncbi:alanine racemase [Arthrobacter methylotrophus]|uniref:Alanine racemase n=1 Tax=Arthrobacter methylotrophus TaxID=121291 RepID=A0ABV5ULF7_9MICC